MTAVSNTTCQKDPHDFLETLCDTSVPKGILPPTQFSWNVSSDKAGNYTSVWNSSSLSVIPQEVSEFLPYGQPAVLGAFTALKLDRDTFGIEKQPSKPSQVNQCVFVYCLKTYDQVEVRSGETIIGPVDESLMTISSHEFFSADEYVLGLSALFTMQGTAANGTAIGPNYTMNYWDYLNIGQYMEDVLDSTVNALYRDLPARTRWRDGAYVRPGHVQR